MNKVNSVVLTTGVFTAVLAGLLCHAKHSRKYFDNKMTCPIITGLIVLSIFILLSMDLKGQAGCKQLKEGGYKPVCRSRFSKMNLPSYFCEEDLQCECVNNSECPAPCGNCVNTICTPTTGHRKMIMNQQSRPNVVFVVLALVSSLILGWLCIRNERSQSLRIGICVIVVAEIITTLFMANRKYSSIVPESACSA